MMTRGVYLLPKSKTESLDGNITIKKNILIRINQFRLTVAEPSKSVFGKSFRGSKLITRENENNSASSFFIDGSKNAVDEDW
jgi:hypothetical protein